MSYDTVAIRAAGDTSNATQDITSSGFGTPKLAMIKLTRATVNNTAKADQIICMGLSDFTDQYSVAGADQDNQATTDADRYSHNARFIYAADADGTVLAEGTVATTTDGIRITWSTNPAEAYLMDVMLWDADWTVKVGKVTSSGSADGTADYTSASFVFEQMICLYAVSITDGAPYTAVSEAVGLGFCDWSGSALTQYSHSFLSINGQASSDLRSETWNDAVAGLAGGNANYEVTAVINNGASSGFTLTTREQNQARTIYFALISSGGNVSHALWTETPPATRPNDTTVTLGWQPAGTIAVQTGSAAFDSQNTNQLAGLMSVGFYDGTTQISCSLSSADNAADSDTQNLSDTKLIHAPAHDGTDTDANAIEATAAITATGFTLSYSKAISTDDIAFGLAWGSAAAAGGNPWNYYAQSA